MYHTENNIGQIDNVLFSYDIYKNKAVRPYYSQLFVHLNLHYVANDFIIRYTARSTLIINRYILNSQINCILNIFVSLQIFRSHNVPFPNVPS